ncbi:carbamate kinase [Coriobacteriia bacterium Es71-Z0120]|uniref:carbamate kinase n=1 Tax=Parvivirga hydrogeniphila TaxID=2939460 RepID=UPI002260E864|nr:carbamate kinase [Parvivirga hydrogeniphila]MCL4078670.1 carbamate kinase [Parvivirga hydrogeniphila]
MSAASEVQLLVIALGGNAILRRSDDGTIETQFRRADESMRQIVPLIAAGTRVVLTHGNGPIVGNIVIRNEAARDRVPPMPLYIADADSEGGIGFMLETSLTNALATAGIDRRAVTVVTRCVVDPHDPAFSRPTKPIGPYYTPEEAARLAKEEGWEFTEVPGAGTRRVVPSPRPTEIVEAPTIAKLAAAGDVVIAAGGGGVPVLRRPDGTLAGVDAVIDKDWASAILAEAISADHLVVLMEADRVYERYGTPAARPLERLTVEQAERLLPELDTGSVGPKVAACAHFARATGKDAVICAVDQLAEALAGRAGTRITAR